jgi:hypothetical protein
MDQGISAGLLVQYTGHLIHMAILSARCDAVVRLLKIAKENQNDHHAQCG